MFPQFGATAETLSKASTMVFRIGTDAHLYDDPEDVNIAPLLDSKFDSEKSEALKRLLALIAQGFDVSNFFPQVVKNVASQSLDVKKLVYLYLLHYAEKRPNEALLSINCFQKDLGDPNPLVRAWALRTMAGIRLHVVAPIVLVAVGKCARDPSVYVRKCAANALPKLYDLCLEENTASIEEIVGILLCDHSPSVVGAAAAAFASVCPNNLSLIARNYRGLCVILPDVEEWGQIILIEILLRYVIARYGFVEDSIMFSLRHTEKLQSEQLGPEHETKLALFEDNGDLSWNYQSKLAHMVSKCYIERPDEYLARSVFKNKSSLEFKGECFISGRSNEDVKILMQCTSPLLWSNNSAVVLAAASVHWIMAPKDDVKRIVKPLLFILRSSNESKYVVLCNIQVFAKAMPFLFASHFEDFFICSSDTYQIKALKLEILAAIAMDSSISLILKEFQDYIRDPDRRFAADTVGAIGTCVQRLPVMANICLKMLLALIKQECFTSDLGSVEGEAAVLVQAIMSTKSIIGQDPPSHEKVMIQLIRSLDSVKVPAARAMIIWMVGEYSSLGEAVPKMLNTVLKYLAWCFASEELEAKLQTLNTATKVLLSAKGEDMLTFRRILSYLLELAKCDMNYDVRDRACFLEKLLLSHLDSEGLEETKKCLPKTKDLSHVLVRCIFGEQTTPMPPEPSDHRFYLPGSLSQIVLHAAPGYEALPKPCSLTCIELETNAFEEEPIISNLSTMDNLDSLSGSSDEESASHYSSQHSVMGSSGSEGSDESGSASEDDESTNPLIKLSDVSNAHMQNGASQSDNAGFEKLMSKKALESWLDEQPGMSSVDTSKSSSVYKSFARISVGDIEGHVKPKSYTLLDHVNGNGLQVEYYFTSEASDVSPLLVCILASFKNCSSETLSDIIIALEESHKDLNMTDQASAITESAVASQGDVPTLISMEDITSLEPGQIVTRFLHVRFQHHLLPLKIALYCNGKSHLVKLRPDIGYFVKALPMDTEAFTIKESHLPGMFEYTRSCIFADHMDEPNQGKGDVSLEKDKFLEICKCLALKMLSNTNFFLVSVDMPITTNLDDATGLCLRFSGELLSNSKPCLITVTVKGKCSEPLNVSIKVNCEETVFGLNLLNRTVNFLSEPSLISRG